ncbi:alpha-2-HS-glycoprotein [Leptodactylus fuscus]
MCCTIPSSPSSEPGHLVNCDDPEVHQAAHAFVQHINNNRNTGYKYTLNEVKNAKVFLSASGEIYSLELDLLETKCPSLSPTPIRDCLVRPIIEQAVEGDCDGKIRKQNGNFTIISFKCKSELDSVENIRRFCPTCNTWLAPLNDTQVVHAVDVSLHKMNVENNSTFYVLHEIGRGRIQSGTGSSVHVEFVIAASNCTLNEANSGRSCVEDIGVKGHFGSCSGSVVKTQGALDEEVVVQCSIFKALPGEVARAHVPAQVPVAPSQTNMFQSRFLHNLYDPSMGPISSESNSAELQLLAAQAGHAVKRSLTGQPVPANVPSLPLCPGRKIHF